MCMAIIVADTDALEEIMAGSCEAGCKVVSEKAVGILAALLGDTS